VDLLIELEVGILELDVVCAYLHQVLSAHVVEVVVLQVNLAQRAGRFLQEQEAVLPQLGAF